MCFSLSVRLCWSLRVMCLLTCHRNTIILLYFLSCNVRLSKTYGVRITASTPCWTLAWPTNASVHKQTGGQCSPSCTICAHPASAQAQRVLLCCKECTAHAWSWLGATLDLRLNSASDKAHTRASTAARMTPGFKPTQSTHAAQVVASPSSNMNNAQLM